MKIWYEWWMVKECQWKMYYLLFIWFKKTWDFATAINHSFHYLKNLFCNHIKIQIKPQCLVLKRRDLLLLWILSVYWLVTFHILCSMATCNAGCQLKTKNWHSFLVFSHINTNLGFSVNDQFENFIVSVCWFSICWNWIFFSI